jgi:hypothetical protein
MHARLSLPLQALDLRRDWAIREVEIGQIFDPSKLLDAKGIAQVSCLVRPGLAFGL